MRKELGESDHVSAERPQLLKCKGSIKKLKFEFVSLRKSRKDSNSIWQSIFLGFSDTCIYHIKLLEVDLLFCLNRDLQ